MSKTLANPWPFQRLCELIRLEEQRTNRFARRVRISQEVATSLATMKAEDWYAAGRGCTDFSDCERLSTAFLRDGYFAATGLSLSIIGPILEVTEDLSAPEVEIVVGIEKV